MSLVRVKDGSKRLREPKILSVDEFRQVLKQISEPFRTMRIVAMCMGLRVSEVLGLKWCDIDWAGSRIGIRQSYVYGKPGAVKTPASQRWMPLDDSLAEKLRQHQLRFGSPVNEEGWIFRESGDGKAVLAWPNSRELACSCRRKGGIGRIGWHTFRHSHLG
jgi:integrase